MKHIDYHINLDLHAEGAQLFRNIQRGDTKSARLIVTFSEEGKPYPLGDTDNANLVVAFAAAKHDNTHFYSTDDITIDTDKNAVIYEMPLQATAAAGVMMCQFKLIDANQVKASPMFCLNIADNPYDEQQIAPSSEDFVALTSIISDLEAKLANHEFDGADGVSCTHQWNGTTLSITSASGTSSANLKGDDGVPYVHKQAPTNMVTGEPDVTSSAFSNLHKGEPFYTYDSTNATRIFYIKHTNSTYLRLGIAGSEHLPEVPYTTITTVDQQTKKVPDVTTHAYSLLVCGQMFLCETATEVTELWVKLSNDQYFKYDERILALIEQSISGKADAATTLAGYGITNAYTKTEVDNLIAAIATLRFEVVQALPSSNIQTNVIYLLPKQTPTTGNIYEEWAYINNNWELLGTTDIDLSGKVDKTQKIANIALSGDISKADLVTAIHDAINPYVASGDSGFSGQFGINASYNPVYNAHGDTTWTELAKASDIPSVPTNVSSFTNDVGYLTQHQDISGKADLSDIPELVNDLTDGATVMRRYSGNSAPPTGDIAAAQLLILPCIWYYDEKAWLIYDKEAGQTAGYYKYKFIQLATKSYVDTLIGGVENGSY